MGFFQSKSHPDIRIRDCGTHYKYNCVYVGDVIFVPKHPMKYIRIMEYEYELKGVGVPEYYLGDYMEVGKDGNMSLSAKIYIKNITESMEKLMEKCLKSWEIPMTEDYHPELDESPLLQGSEAA